jgi:hypothetical protein
LDERALGLDHLRIARKFDYGRWGVALACREGRVAYMVIKSLDYTVLPETAMKAERHAFCAECKGWFEVQNMVAYNDLHVCARCKPIFLQKLAEGIEATPAPTARSRRMKSWLLLLVVAVVAVISGWFIRVMLTPLRR